MLRSTATYITPVGFIGRPRLGDTCTAPYYQSRMYSRTFPGDRGGEPPPLRRRRANTDAGRIGARTEEEINVPLSHGRNALSPVGRDQPWDCRVVTRCPLEFTGPVQRPQAARAAQQRIRLTNAGAEGPCGPASVWMAGERGRHMQRRSRGRAIWHEGPPHCGRWGGGAFVARG